MWLYGRERLVTMKPDEIWVNYELDYILLPITSDKV